MSNSDKTNEKVYRLNYRRLFASNGLDNAANSLTSSALIVGYALFIGLDESIIGVFIAMRLAFASFQIFSPYIFSRTGQSKKVVLAWYSIFRLCNYLIIFIPFITGDPTVRLVLFLVLISLGSILAQMLYSPMNNWKMQVLRPGDARMYFAYKNLVTQVVAATASIGLSVLLDLFADTYFEYWIFFITLTTIFLIAVVDIIIRICLVKPTATDKPKLSLKETFVAPLKNKVTRQSMALLVMYHFFRNIGILFLAVYQIQYVGLSFVYISILLILYSLSSMLGGIMWGKIANKRNNYNAVLLCCLACLVAMFAMLAFSSVNIIVYLFPLVFILYGLSQSGFGMFESLSIHQSASPEHRIATLSLSKFFIGLSSIVLVLLSIFVVESTDNEATIRIFFIVAMAGLVVATIYFVLSKKGKDNSPPVLQ